MLSCVSANRLTNDVSWHIVRKSICISVSGHFWEIAKVLLYWMTQTAAGFDSFISPWLQRNTKSEPRHFNCKFTVCQLLLQIVSSASGPLDSSLSLSVRMDFDGKFSSNGDSIIALQYHIRQCLWSIQWRLVMCKVNTGQNVYVHALF